MEEEKAKIEAAMEMYEQLGEQSQQLQEKVALLEETKDAEEVKEIKAKFMPEKERYEELVECVNEALNKLSDIEVRCVYASFIDTFWNLTEYTWGNDRQRIEKALQSKWIYEGGDGLKANEDHPKMRPVFSQSYYTINV